MRIRVPLTAVAILAVLVTTAFEDHHLNGAYKFVSVSFEGGKQTEAEIKGMIVVYGRYWAKVRCTLNRKPWTQEEPEDERTKKMAAAFQGLTANAGTFETKGNIVTMHNDAAASPGAVGTSSKWEYKLDGNKLILKPQAAPGVEFIFEKLP